MSRIFARFFQIEEDDSSPEEDYRDATAPLEFSRLAYYQRLMTWLETEAMRPVNIGEGRDMVISAVRQNTLLEVRNLILKDISRASAAAKRKDG